MPEKAEEGFGIIKSQRILPSAGTRLGEGGSAAGRVSERVVGRPQPAAF